MWLAPIGLWEFALCALAGHRLWVTYNQEDIFLPLRRFVSRRIHVKLGGMFNLDGTPVIRTDKLGQKYVVGPCQFCTSVWAGLITFATWFLPYVGPVAVTIVGVISAMGAWDVVMGAVYRSGYQPPSQLMSFPVNDQPKPNLVVAER